MRVLTGVVLAATLAACGGGGHSAAKATTGFVTATRAAWQSASVVSASSPSGEQKAAVAWSGFAFTVGHLDAGDDTTQQGQLVAMAQQASAAFAADYAAFQCHTTNSFNSGYESPQPCPPASGKPDSVVAQIQQTVQGL